MKWSPPLEFINQRGSPSRFHQPKGGPSLNFINQKGIPSTQRGVRLQGQFLWIQRYSFFQFCTFPQLFDRNKFALTCLLNELKLPSLTLSERSDDSRARKLGQHLMASLPRCTPQSSLSPFCSCFTRKNTLLRLPCFSTLNYFNLTKIHRDCLSFCLSFLTKKTVF